MRRALPVLAAVAALAACASGPSVRPAAGEPSVPAREPVRPRFEEPPEVKDPDFVLSVSETVPDPTDDGICYTKVFVDGKEAGKTAVGRKGTESVLKLKLPAGNRLIRLEHWVLPPIGEWTALDADQQPRERFVRIEDGTIARLELRFAEGESSNTLTLSRGPASALAP